MPLNSICFNQLNWVNYNFHAKPLHPFEMCTLMGLGNVWTLESITTIEIQNISINHKSFPYDPVQSLHPSVPGPQPPLIY